MKNCSRFTTEKQLTGFSVVLCPKLQYSRLRIKSTRMKWSRVCMRTTKLLGDEAAWLSYYREVVVCDIIFHTIQPTSFLRLYRIACHWTHNRITAVQLISVVTASSAAASSTVHWRWEKSIHRKLVIYSSKTAICRQRIVHRTHLKWERYDIYWHATVNGWNDTMRLYNETRDSQ